LQSGDIDCAPQPAPWNFLAERAGYHLIGEVNDVLPEVVFAAVIADLDWAARHRDVVGRLVAALREAHETVNDPSLDAVSGPIYQRITTPDDPELAARGLAYTRDMGMWPTDLVVTPTALQVSIDLMVHAGLLAPDKRESAVGVFDATFVTEG
jgi:NitT/TauT family transport system substrate-binding protein